jgi:paired amphipathic helix protein Sin3a
MDSSGELGPSAGMGPHGRAEFYDQSRPGWQQQQQQPQQQPQQQQPGNLPGSYSPGSRMMGPGIFGQQGGHGQPQDHHFDYPTQQEQQAAAGAAAMAHGQDQRGVSQLQGAASAASAALGRPSLMQVSPASGQNPNLTQPMSSLAGVGSGMLQGTTQADLKRGPVEFNHAISYVNKIKVRF